MDIQRADLKGKNRRRKILWGSGLGLGIILLGFWVMNMGKAVPEVERSSIWIGTVKRGDLIREVRGIGSLVPKDQRWLTAQTDGSVEEIHLLPGAKVEPETVILELSNPELEQNLRSAKLQLSSAEAELANQRVREQDAYLEMEFQRAQLVADYENAKLDERVNAELFSEGLVAERELIRSRVAKDQLEQQVGILNRRLETRREQMEQNLAPAIVAVEQERERVDMLKKQVSDLQVRAGLRGLLQRLPLEEGQQVTMGTQLAQVANPDLLKATVRIPETQAKDITLGQSAKVDTRNGIISGRVERINPTVTAGTVDVDIELGEELPRGARADLTVEGYVELANLPDVLYVTRPSFARENSTLGVYRITHDKKYAERIQVTFGKSSVNEIEISAGLSAGDEIILSDPSSWEESNRIKLK